MKKVKFLIVSSDALLRQIIITTLKQLGFYDFVEASEHEKAFFTLSDNEISFIIMNWDSDKSSSLIKFIRNDKEYTKLPILVLAFRNEKEEVDEDVCCIYKPFFPESLEEKIKKLIKQKYEEV